MAQLNEWQRREIFSDINKGKVAVILGSGASAPCGRPTASTLATILAEECSFPSDDPKEITDLMKVATWAYLDRSRQRTAEQKVREILMQRTNETETPLNPVYERLAQNEKPLLILTTNYDLDLEAALHRNNKPLTVITHCPNKIKEVAQSYLFKEPGHPTRIISDAELCKTNLAERWVIYKMHGSLGETETEDDFVITEDHYIEFLSSMPVSRALYPILAEKRLLFLGCSLADPDLRVLLFRLQRFRKWTKSWAIVQSVTHHDEKAWDARGVDVLTYDLRNFADSVLSNARF